MRSSLLGVVALTLLLPVDIARAAPGDPDTSFSGDGQLILDFAGGPALGHAVAIGPNGAIVVAGEYRATGTLRTTISRMVRIHPGGGVEKRTTDIDGGRRPRLRRRVQRLQRQDRADRLHQAGCRGSRTTTSRRSATTPALQSRPRVQRRPARRRVDFGTGAVAKGVAIDSLLRIVQVGTANVGTGQRRLRAHPPPGHATAPSTPASRRTASRPPTSAGSTSETPSRSTRRQDRGRRGQPGRPSGLRLRGRPLPRASTARSTIPASGPTATARRTSAAPARAANGVAIQPDGKIVRRRGHGHSGTSLLARYNDGRHARHDLLRRRQADDGLRRRPRHRAPAWRSSPTAGSSSRATPSPAATHQRLRARPLQPGRLARHDLLGRRQADVGPRLQRRRRPASRCSPTARSCSAGYSEPGELDRQVRDRPVRGRRGAPPVATAGRRGRSRRPASTSRSPVPDASAHPAPASPRPGPPARTSSPAPWAATSSAPARATTACAAARRRPAVRRGGQ